MDVFHDVVSAVEESSRADLQTLEGTGFTCRVSRQNRGFVEALVHRGDESVLVQWAADSAYRLFPLVEHDDFGLTLHPFDLATNKVLALVGRLEVRDWLDVLDAHRTLPPLEVGRAVLDEAGRPFVGKPADLDADAGAASLRFHEGRLGGAVPVVQP